MHKAIIPSIVCYRFQTWLLIYQDEHKLKFMKMNFNVLVGSLKKTDQLVD